MRTLIVVGLLIQSLIPASAKILKSVRQADESSETRLTFGSGLDFQTDEEETEYDFPFLFEYPLSEKLLFAAEPGYIVLHRKDKPTVSGFGDLETSLSWDFIGEENRRPALSALGLVKWPTAANDQLGSGETDFTLGLSAGKEFEPWLFDLGVLYTFVGSPPGTKLQNSLEFIFSVERECSDVIALLGELSSIDGAGRSHGQSGAIQGLAGRLEGSERALTLGIAEQLGEALKLEQGFTALTDGSWQVAVGWEFAVGE